MILFLQALAKTFLKLIMSKIKHGQQWDEKA
jgi:hypothetical protein